MKEAQAYLLDQPKGESILKLVERVQREAYEAGYNTCAHQIMGIADESAQRVAATTSALMDTRQHC